MEVEEYPDDPFFTPEVQAEIEDIIQQIACGSGEGRWTEPDTVRITRKLAGGKSGAVVLEAEVQTDRRTSLKVIKVGPIFDLRNEFNSYRKIKETSDLTAQFVPLLAVTRGLLPETSRPQKKQAVVYDHAEKFVGNAEDVVTFETIAAEALRSDATIRRAETVLAELFKGIRRPLYDAQNVKTEATSLRCNWNFRLGFDAVVSVRQVIGEERKLTIGDNRSALLPKSAKTRALEIRDPRRRTTEFVALSEERNPTVEWWELDGADDILTVQLNEPHFIRYHVKSGVEGKTLRDLDRDEQIRDGDAWALLGEVEDWRNERHRAVFLSRLGPDFQIADGKLTGPESVVADPFPLLAEVLDQKRPNRITSWAHGDLNSRNILVAENRPCLIDYAFTREGEPLMFDFVRLEGTLAAEILPDDLTWAEHVRLQRYLALACRLAGPTASEQHLDRIAQELSGRLSVEKVELGRAFRLFWAVRKAAREVTPPEYREGWARDYVEQLFLFGHQMLKWFDKTSRHSAMAVAAILGVTAETLQPARVYRFWDHDELAENAPLFLQLMEPQAEFLLTDLASLGRVLPRKLIQSPPFRAAREKLVRRRFQDRAREIKESLTTEHNVFIRLKAFIELKGQLKEAGKRASGGIELNDMLESDEQLAERERLRTKEGDKGEDALTLITRHAPVVLLGDAGAGKSTVSREWEYRLAKTILDHDSTMEARLPVVIPASKIADELSDWDPEKPGNLARHLAAHVADFPAQLSLAQLFEAGAACLVIDALNEVGDRRQAVAQWAEAFHRAFPLAPLIVCHRQYNYPAGLLPFPVVTLQKVEANQARRYIRESLGSTEKEEGCELADDLIRLLLDDPDQEQVRDLAQTPLFLWMVVEYYREKRDLPENRARLFEDFSEWYLQENHHQGEFGEKRKLRFDFQEKAALLGRLGHQLVERRETVLNKTAVDAVLTEFEDEATANPNDVLAEIVATELVRWEDGSGDQLRFLHQSFQEYFAARHLLDHLDRNADEIAQRVWEFGWHDTFVLVLGFGGQNPQVVTQVVEAALEVNPGLTARCLRMAELEDRSALLEKFVDAQESVLRDPSVGVWAYRISTAALAEYGRGRARAVLWQIVTDRGAPDEARRFSIEELAKLPGQVRFEAVAERLREEFRVNLSQVFEEPAPQTVQRAAINAVVRVKLNQLSEFLTDLVREGEWPLRKAAWEALDKLGQTRTQKLHDLYTAACEERLDSLEIELYAESVTERIQELNRERVAILQQVAAPSMLEPFLMRRFSFITTGPSWWNWDDLIARKLDRFASLAAPDSHTFDRKNGLSDVAKSTLAAWKVLASEETDIQFLCATFELPQSYEASPQHGLDWLAAAHRLDAIAEEVPEFWLNHWINCVLADLESSIDFNKTGRTLWLSALSQIVGHSRKASLIEPLDRLIRVLVAKVSSRDEVEVLCNLCVALSKLDFEAANQAIAIAECVFWVERFGEMHNPGLFPWRLVGSTFSLTDSDFESLLTFGDLAEAQAAVFQLQAYGRATSREANRSSSSTQLSAEAMGRLNRLTHDETDSMWRLRFANAAVECHAVTLLPWLLRTGRQSQLRSRSYLLFDLAHGQIREFHLADFLRSIGYLTRFTLDQNNQTESNEEPPPLQPALDAIADLRERYAKLQRQLAAGEEPHRSIIHGLTVALGYLGEWEPILTHLGPGEPWQHEAAKNIFEHWVPGPVEVISPRDPEGERERAAQWIAGRLSDAKIDLSPDVRTTYAEILEQLEQKLGRHVR